jgi:group I intron endonuclease
VGSSVNLGRRFSQYFNVNNLTRQNYMAICRGLLKYGYSGFYLEILEYCDSSELLTREKHYMDILKPKYNISAEPSHPFLGRNHSDETKAKLSTFFKGKVYPERTGENNPFFGKTHPDDTRNKISEAKKGISLPKFSDEHKSKKSAAMMGKNKGENSPLSQKILVIDVLTDDSTIYPSMRVVAPKFTTTGSTIKVFAENGKLFKDEYRINIIS